jgi:hypothetical protein
LLQPLQESGDAGLPYRIVRCGIHEHANATHALALLRARRERPRSRFTPKSYEGTTWSI